jgi:hypothetical protein
MLAPAANGVRVEIKQARLFFPDERADELVLHLRRHWAAHPVTTAAAVGPSPATAARL